MAMGTAAVLPEAARPGSSVATPGRVAGENVTVPVISEVAAAVWAASRLLGGQTVRGLQGGGPAVEGLPRRGLLRFRGRSRRRRRGCV